MVLVAVVCSAAGCLYLGVLAAALMACACMDIPLASVSWCFMVFLFFCVALCVLGGLFPLMLSHTLTLLVSWCPRPMRAGNVSGRALLLVAVRPLCPFPPALRTLAPFRLWQRGASYNI